MTGMAPRRRSFSRSAALLTLMLTAASALAACDGGSDGGRPPSVAESPPPTAATEGVASPTDSTPDDTAGPTVGDVTGTVSPTAGGVERDFADGDGIATLLAVRVATRPESGAERVVLEFDGEGVPRYEIAYARPPFSQCGSGHPVAVAGGAVLRVRLHATRAHAESGEDILPTVTERDRTLDQKLLRQLTLTCDFEAEVEWLLGVTARAPYRILELRSPARLVVDLMGGR